MATVPHFGASRDPGGRNPLHPAGVTSGMEWKLFADLADVAGDRRVEVAVDAGATVGDALAALLEERPALEGRLLDEAGRLRDHLTVLRNGSDVSGADGLDTEVAAGDELAIFPPVSGGNGGPAGSPIDRRSRRSR